jgi:hypothetical protein
MASSPDGWLWHDGSSGPDTKLEVQLGDVGWLQDARLLPIDLPDEDVWLGCVADDPNALLVPPEKHAAISEPLSGLLLDRVDDTTTSDDTDGDRERISISHLRVEA